MTPIYKLCKTFYQDIAINVCTEAYHLEKVNGMLLVCMNKFLIVISWKKGPIKMFESFESF